MLHSTTKNGIRQSRKYAWVRSHQTCPMLSVQESLSLGWIELPIAFTPTDTP